MEFKKLKNPWGYAGDWYESREDFDGENELIVTLKFTMNLLTTA
jgi:hypothetical protein